MVVLRSIHEGFGIIYFNTTTYMFGVHPQVTAEALPQMTARCAISFQYFSTSVLLHLRKSITPLIMTLLQTPQNSFWYVLRESTVIMQGLLVVYEQ